MKNKKGTRKEKEEEKKRTLARLHDAHQRAERPPGRLPAVGR